MSTAFGVLFLVAVILVAIHLKLKKAWQRYCIVVPLAIACVIFMKGQFLILFAVLLVALEVIINSIITWIKTKNAGNAE